MEIYLIDQSDRSRDTGQYKIVLESPSGICQASGFVNVLDVPGPPMSFEVKQIFPDKVTFSWKQPYDDGGRPIKHYQIRMMDFETGDWHIVGDVKQSFLPTGVPTAFGQESNFGSFEFPAIFLSCWFFVQKCVTNSYIFCAFAKNLKISRNLLGHPVYHII